MKTETKKIEVTTYIARDGREFRNKTECADYEDYLNRESVLEDAKQHVKSLKAEVSKDNLPFIPLETFLRYDGNMKMIKSKMQSLIDRNRLEYYSIADKKDAKALAEVMSNTGCGNFNSEEILKVSGRLRYPCTVLRSLDYHYGRKMGTFLNEMEIIKKYANVHGYKLTIQPIEEESQH